MHPRLALKSQLLSKGITPPVDTVTSELERMLKAAGGFGDEDMAVLMVGHDEGSIMLPIIEDPA